VFGGLQQIFHRGLPDLGLALGFGKLEDEITRIVQRDERTAP
jgi:hypothetical protein